MKLMKLIAPVVIAITVFGLIGCGVSKDKYESVLSDKIILEEKVDVLTRSKDALKAEYDSLLKEQMDLATKVEILGNEKAALKSEYDKILDEKIAIRAAYDKLQSDIAKKARR